MFIVQTSFRPTYRGRSEKGRAWFDGCGEQSYLWGNQEVCTGAYAEQVSGEIRAVIGSELRPGNIWENIELPRLKNNPNVTKITTIDPKTGIEHVIFERWENENYR